MNNEQSNYTKGLVLGVVLGGTIGAITALLLAPKSGRELRQDIATTSSDIYGKASDYCDKISDTVGTSISDTFSDGKVKAQQIINSAKEQAGTIINKAEEILANAKVKAGNVKDAAKDGVTTFKDALKSVDSEEDF